MKYASLESISIGSVDELPVKMDSTTEYVEKTIN